MAEKAAHLSPIAQIQPSLFDYFAANSLDALLYPICQRFIGVLATRQGFARLPEFFTEVYYLGYSLLQFLHLKSFGATFSEKFYGLKRESVNNFQNNSQLGKKELLLSLITVSLIPYLKQKLNEEIENFSTLDLPNDNFKVHRKVFLNLAKVVNGLFSGAEIIQSIRYLSGSTKTLSLLHWFSRVRLIYKSDEISNNIWETLPFIIKVGVFFYQFLQMMPNALSSRISSNLVEPPQKKLKEEDEIQLGNGNTCPLCGKKRNLDTVLSTSGYVFCFQCIMTYVMKHGLCPVTKLPSTLDSLIRIYSPL